MTATTMTATTVTATATVTDTSGLTDQVFAWLSCMEKLVVGVASGVS